MSYRNVGEFHLGAGHKIHQFPVFERKTHLLEMVNRKRNF